MLSFRLLRGNIEICNACVRMHYGGRKMVLAGMGSRLLNNSLFSVPDQGTVRYMHRKKMSGRLYSSRAGMGKLIADMTPNELLSVFLSDQSNRMEKCKAGERLLVETAPVTEQVAVVDL